MCSFMGAIAAVAGIAGTMARASAQSQQIEAANKAANWNARIEMDNAEIAHKQAEDAKKIGLQEVEQNERKYNQLIGEHTTGLTASGVELTGTAAQLLGQDAVAKQEDKHTILSNTDKNIWGYNMQANNHTNRANLYYASKQDYNPIGSILGGFTETAMGTYSLIKG